MCAVELQTPEEMLLRWSGSECKCDRDVGYLCELCHDSAVVRNLLKERDRYRDGVLKFQSTLRGISKAEKACCIEQYNRTARQQSLELVNKAYWRNDAVEQCLLLLDHYVMRTVNDKSQSRVT